MPRTFARGTNTLCRIHWTVEVGSLFPRVLCSLVTVACFDCLLPCLFAYLLLAGPPLWVQGLFNCLFLLIIILIVGVIRVLILLVNGSGTLSFILCIQPLIQVWELSYHIDPICHRRLYKTLRRMCLSRAHLTPITRWYRHLMRGCPEDVAVPCVPSGLLF